MLRITKLIDDRRLTLRLEGRLLGPWVDELRACCNWAVDAASLPARLDLEAVSFVDAGGLELLRQLREHGVQLDHCSNFITELLNAEMP